MKKKLCQDESFDTVSFSFLYFPDGKPKDLAHGQRKTSF